MNNPKEEIDSERRIKSTFNDFAEKAEQHYPGISELIQVHAEFQKTLQLHRQLGHRTFSTSSSNSSTPVF